MSTGDAPELYHRWFYDNEVWKTTEFLGVPVQKSPMDLWNYQEIIYALKPPLIVEFGVYNGGSSLFFATIGSLVRPDAMVLSIDVDLSNLHANALRHPSICFRESSSSAPSVATAIARMRSNLPGPIFVVVDSDHRKAHVMAELELLRAVTAPGDYVIVEDGNINGHPILPGWGEGPWEALEDYFAKYPGDYVRDEAREAKFGFTFAPRGFLIRR